MVPNAAAERVWLNHTPDRRDERVQYNRRLADPPDRGLLPVNGPWRPFPRPWVIAHRGASGLLPEHTLPGYALAIEQGADVIEPDLVASADGVLYARHDLGLARSTDIASRSEFSGYRRPGVDGSEDWWIEDLSSAQIDSLRAIQPWPQRPHDRDGVFGVPRFGAVLALLLTERQRRERPLLIYPELKHPQHFQRLGIDVVELLARELESVGLTGPDAPVLVQCFERDCLDRVRSRIGVRVVQLSLDLPTLDGSTVDGYGVSKQALMTPAGAGFIAAAHELGRAVHAWTFRDDQPHVDYAPEDECARAFEQGCDGLFSDFPATALAARARRERAAQVRVLSLVGAQIAPFLPALAALRIRVFREWPYLYDGDADYEARYLQTYSRSARSLFVLALDGDEVVGCATAIPLSDASEDCLAPFVGAGIDLDTVCYFGESVLDRRYRGRGLGHRFFDAREAHARSLPKLRYSAFCAVQRAADDPRRPSDYRPLDRFWSARGYLPRPDLLAQFAWKELGGDRSESNTMMFWLREWPP